jgi:hypothetical protein
VLASRPILLAVEPDGSRAVCGRWGELIGTNARLIAVLADFYRQSQREQLAPERYRFTQSGDLADALGVGNDDTLRRTVLRCRKRLVKLAIAAGEAPPALDAVIENIQGHGYRLNPDTVRLVAMAEIEPAD